MAINKRQFTSMLESGIEVDDIFLVGRKTIGTNRKDKSKYCKVDLVDREGSVEGVLWSECFEKTKDFRQGDFVRIKGMASEYNGKKQVIVKELCITDSHDVIPEEYIKSTKKDIGNMLIELDTIIQSISNRYLAKLLRSFFDDKGFRERFSKSTAAMQYHHAYIGGLLEHTLSVTNICIGLAEHYRDLDRDLLVAGAMLHDIGKVEEYKTGTSFSLTDSGRLIGHITLGYGMARERISDIEGFPNDLKDSLLHIILSHHGFQEYGSPKCPKVLEAFIVFHVDFMDAEIGGYRMIEEGRGEESGWSGFSKQFQRSVLLKKKEKDRIPPEIKEKVKKALEGKDDKKEQEGLF